MPAQAEPTLEPEPASAMVAETEPEPTSAQGEDESLTEATIIEPRSGPEIEERAYEEAAIEESDAPEPAEAAESPYANAAFDITTPAAGEPAAAADEDWKEPPQAEADDDQFAPYPVADEEPPRRRRPLLTILLVVLLIAAVAVAFWFLAPPEWKARLGLGTGGASPLALVTTHMDRQRLASGNELLTVTGRVINPTGKEQDVPPLQAQLRTRAGKVVYSWTIAPPARTLPAGASASFNSAEVNVPPGGDELTITLGSAGA